MELFTEKMNVVKTNLYEQIADKLEDAIISEGPAGEDKLPSEQALAEQFCVSRNVIREALKLLKERGLIESKNGTGSYITKPEAHNLSDVISRIVLMDNIDYKAIYDVRIILETAACRRAAENVSRQQLLGMEQLLERLRDKSLDVATRRLMDYDFHVAIAKAAGNPLLVIFVEAMKNVFLDMIEKGIILQGGIDDGIIRHDRIFKALQQKDADLAEQMMYDHLYHSRKNVEKYFSDMEMEN